MEITPYKKKDGKTYYKFIFYNGFENGKRKYIKRGGFKTKSEARAAITLLQEELEKPKSQMTFQALTSQWLIEYEKDVAESTYVKTDRNLKNHILPDIGKKQLSELTPLLLQSYQNNWAKKLKYARKLLGIIRNILNFAVKYGYIENNPALSVTTPRIKRQLKSHKDFYDKNELRQFMEIIQKTNDIEKIALFRILAFTGIRKGELLALEWGDIVDNTLHINKAVTRTPAGLEVSVTKTKSSERLISLDPQTVEVINRLHQAFPKRKRLFENDNNGIMTPSKPRKWLLSAIEGSKLSPIKIHGFRHTHASLLFDAGLTLKQVQYRLGHSDLKTTMNVYTHITQKAIDDIGRQFSEYINF